MELMMPSKPFIELPAPQVIQETDLLALHDIEKTAYSFPWSLAAFQDCISSHYWMQKLTLSSSFVQADEEVLAQKSSLQKDFNATEMDAYIVAMPVLDEVHLLNITVKPCLQGQGLGRYLLQHLQAWAQSQNAQSIWLEVRASNSKAIALYLAYGFIQKGRRKAYYPDAAGKREDAIVMSLALQEAICT
jgi:ribosomal-protein-alanine N-acetyltransferase